MNRKKYNNKKDVFMQLKQHAKSTAIFSIPVALYNILLIILVIFLGNSSFIIAMMIELPILAFFVLFICSFVLSIKDKYRIKKMGVKNKIINKDFNLAMISFGIWVLSVILSMIGLILIFTLTSHK